MATIIKGDWNKKEAEVRAAQSGPFIFITGIGALAGVVWVLT